MENLSKIVKKLSDKEYQHLLELVSGNKRNKPFHVLEYIRTETFDEEYLIQKLDINQNAYYTLKSRLLDKVAIALAHKPINAIKEKVANVSVSIFQDDRSLTIKYLKDLEKELLEYDLSNELIVVYKALARHYLYEPEEYEKYDLLYNKHVAYSLAMEKAEDLLLMFIRNVGNFRLSRTQEDFEKILRIRREMYNITEMFTSHRLFVLNNIISIYYQCLFSGNTAELKDKEMEIEGILKEFETIFNKYHLDAFYQNRKPLIDLMFVLYYYSIGSIARGNVYYKSVKAQLPEIIGKHSYTFYIVMLLRSKLEKYYFDGNLEDLKDVNSLLESDFEIDEIEIYHRVRYSLFLSYIKFFEKDYHSVEKIVKELKIQLTNRQFMQGCLECQLLLCLIYSLLGDEEKRKKAIGSLERQLDLDKPENKNIYLFIKFLKHITKHGDYERRLKSSKEIYEEYCKINHGINEVLKYIKIDEDMMLQLAGQGSKKASH